MMPATPTSEISFGPHARLCFYPSSGDRALWVLMRLDCDLFVMADKWREAVSWRRIQADFKKQDLPIELVHQGVLVAPHHGSHDRFKASDLVVLPKGNFPTQLDNLIPFRIQYGQGVLAECRVYWEYEWDGGLGRVGSN